MDVRDFRSSGRVKLSLSRKRIKLDETLTGSRDPGDDSNPEVLGAASDKKSCCSLTGTHLEAERLENTQPSSRRLRHADAEEPRGGESHDVEVHSQVLCPLCHMELTNLSITCRQEHVNKCFETQSGRSQQAEVPAAHVCVLCAKPFKSEQSKLLHMKQCAKRDGISTEALVQLNRVAVESLLTAPLTAPLSNQSNCPAVTSETGEMDFKPSLSKGRKPKKQKAPTDYLQLINEDQLQMALALSASIDTRTSSITAEHQQRPGGKRTRQQKMCDDVIPPLLLTTTTESEKLLAARAEMILVPSEDLHGKEDDIASTQPFPPSRLGQSAPPTSCAKGVSFGDKDTLVGGGDCVDREGYSESNHLVVQSSIPSVPHGSTCDWLNLSRDNAHKDTDPQEGSVIDSSALRTEAGLLGCGGDHLEYPTVWHLTGYQNTATIDCFYVPALKTVISPVKHTSDVLASVVTPAMPMPSFGGVERLLADLHGLLGSTSFSDVVMVTRNGTRIPSHAAILSSRCPSLREVLHGSHSSPVLLDLTEFSNEGVLDFLEWLYTGSCSQLSPPLQGEVASLVERCLRGEGLAELCVATPGSSEGWGGGESRRTFPADTQRLPAMPSQGSPVLLAPRSFVQISSQATSVRGSTQCVRITQPAEQLPMASMEGNDVIKCAVAPLECGMTDCPIPSEGCVLTISPAPPEGLNVSPAPQEGRGLNISPAPQEGRGLINSPILIDSSTSDEGEEGGPVNGMCGTLNPAGRRPSSPLRVPSSPLRIPSSPLRIPSSPLRIPSSPLRGPSSSPSALSCAAIRGVSGVLASPPDKSCDETLIFNELCSRSCDQEFTTCLLTARSCDIDAVEQHPSGVHDNLGSTLHPVGSPVECHSPLVHTSRPMDLSSSRQSVCGVHTAVLPHPHSPSNEGCHPHSPSNGGCHPHSPSNEGCSVSVFSSPGKLDTPTSSPVQPNYPEHISSPVTISSSPSYAPCSPGTTHPHAIRLSSSGTDPSTHLGMPSPSRSPPPQSPLSPPPWSPPWSPPPQSPLNPAVLSHLQAPNTPPSSIPSPPPPIPSPPHLITSPPTMDKSTFLHAFEDNVTESEPHPSLGADHLPRLAVRDHMTCVATPTTCDGAGENDVTPMPDYQTMRTPALRDQCTRYGVRPLPKRKMIAKLREIYEYTHPMVDQSAEAIISSSQPAVNKGLVAMETSPVAASDEICGSQPTTSVIAKAAKHRSGMNLQELRDSVREAIMKDQELYGEILMYKPLELVYIQERLKAASVTIARDKLREMLDQLCITYSCPRPRPPC